MTFQVTWYKDGSEVKPGKVFQVVYSLGICSLETSCCELSDAGKFTCKAENSLGSDECSCKVTVAGKNIFIGLNDIVKFAKYLLTSLTGMT